MTIACIVIPNVAIVPADGTHFRKSLLLPNLKAGRNVRVDVDGLPWGDPTFFDAAFGGLITEDGMTLSELAPRLTLSGTAEWAPAAILYIKARLNDAEEGRLAQWVADVQFPGCEFVVETDDGHPYLQIRHGGQDVWSGRKWRLSYHMTRSEVVQTAFKAVLTAQEHEAREAFRYRGQAVYSPHFNVDALHELAEMGAFDVRAEVRPDAMQ